MKRWRSPLMVCFLLISLMGSSLAQTSRTFTDSSGREVLLPADITRIAVTGPMTQHIIFALAPEMLVGISSPWDEEALPYIPQDYLSLPTIGQLYGGKGTMNVEALLAAEPQIVLDVGESKSGLGAEMDELSHQTGIPFIHIDADLFTYDKAFLILGELLNRPEEAGALATYWRSGLQKAQDAANAEEKIRLLYIAGEEGLAVIARGSYQASVIDLMADNAAVVGSPSSRGTGNEVDMEQLMLWDPECIIFSSDSIYSSVADDSLWQNLTAVKTGHFYEAPYGPHNWMGFPPACQRMMGMLWMGKLLYPESANYDLYEEIRTYFKLFYHSDLNRDQFDQIVQNSIQKENLK